MSVPLVGLDMLHYAEVVTDTSTGTTYGTPVHIEKAVSLSVSPSSGTNTFIADTGPALSLPHNEEVDVSIMAADLTPAVYAFLIGASHDPVTGIVDVTGEGVGPDVAIGFRAKRSNGFYRYVWLLKGRFTAPNMEHQTQDSRVNFQSSTINGKFFARESDNKIYRRVNSEDSGLTLPGDWFADPNVS